MSTRRFTFIGVLVALVLAGFVSLYASSSPDGLESVLLYGCTTDEAGSVDGGECVLQGSGEHEVGGAFADYGMSFLDNEFLGASLAGILGVILTLAIATGFFWLLARGKKKGHA
jgi:cobalt/nickel transport protein